MVLPDEVPSSEHPCEKTPKDSGMRHLLLTALQIQIGILLYLGNLLGIQLMPGLNGKVKAG